MILLRRPTSTHLESTLSTPPRYSYCTFKKLQTRGHRNQYVRTNRSIAPTQWHLWTWEDGTAVTCTTQQFHILLMAIIHPALLGCSSRRSITPSSWGYWRPACAHTTTSPCTQHSEYLYSFWNTGWKYLRFNGRAYLSGHVPCPPLTHSADGMIHIDCWYNTWYNSASTLLEATIILILETCPILVRSNYNYDIAL